jgi:hypothetical protein
VRSAHVTLGYPTAAGAAGGGDSSGGGGGGGSAPEFSTGWLELSNGTILDGPIEAGGWAHLSVRLQNAQLVLVELEQRCAPRYARMHCMRAAGCTTRTRRSGAVPGRCLQGVACNEFSGSAFDERCHSTCGAAFDVRCLIGTRAVAARVPACRRGNCMLIAKPRGADALAPFDAPSLVDFEQYGDAQAYRDHSRFAARVLMLNTPSPAGTEVAVGVHNYAGGGVVTVCLCSRTCCTLPLVPVRCPTRLRACVPL